MSPNHFTEVLLPLYTALQPKFREVMEEWRVGDAYFNGVDIWYSELNYTEYASNGHAIPHACQLPEEFLWLPRTIDDFSEEARKRSLVEMFAPNTFVYLKPVMVLWAPDESGTLESKPIDDNNAIHGVHTGKWGCMITGNRLFVGATPTEAILKALAAQEGKEGK